VKPGNRVRDFGCEPGFFTREFVYGPDAVFDTGFSGKHKRGPLFVPSEVMEPDVEG